MLRRSAAAVPPGIDEEQRDEKAAAQAIQPVGQGLPVALTGAVAQQHARHQGVQHQIDLHQVAATATNSVAICVSCSCISAGVQGPVELAAHQTLQIKAHRSEAQIQKRGHQGFTHCWIQQCADAIRW